MPAQPHQLRTRHRRLLADTVTPVGLYLRLRDHYSNCLLLESADYHGQQNAFSYLVCEPLATFELRRGGALHQTGPHGQATTEQLAEPREALARLHAFAAGFVPDAGPRVPVHQHRPVWLPGLRGRAGV
nr:hypothetical protein [Hymenobacter coccineus]